MQQKTLREMVGHKGLKRGTLVWEFVTPGIGHLLAAAGSDFVFLDAEHSGVGIDTLKIALRYFEAAGVAVLVRPPAKSYAHIANTLDVGAEGVILPMVGSAEEAQRIGDLAGSAELAVTEVAAPVDLTSAPRNRFMSPLGTKATTHD